uniref:endonuclease V n=1 Tax=Thaumasiovibrio occultus TaxID=1891184 RepID=UPI000B353650|nr:endonuclease V [Thaumasiovibrio occultus]
MILAIDVQYTETAAYVAGVLFECWDADSPIGEFVTRVEEVAPYQPGQFYKRELPCILALLNEHSLAPITFVIDGYVYLDGASKAGLGKHLFDALQQKAAKANGGVSDQGRPVEVIGVAKKAFVDISTDCELFRGTSQKPLYVTTTGDVSTAKSAIALMAGKHRIPTLLKRADQLCREAAK